MKKTILIILTIIAVLGFILGFYFKTTGVDGNGIILVIAAIILIAGIFLRYRKTE